MRNSSKLTTTKPNTIIISNKKLSCRRNTARCFASLNISPSHSRSFKVIRNDTLEYGRACVLVFHCNWVCISSLRYSASNNGLILKSGLEDTQGHSKRYHSKAGVWFSIRIP